MATPHQQPPLPASKPWYKRWWAIAAMVVLGLGLIGQAFGGTRDKETSATPTTQVTVTRTVETSSTPTTTEGATQQETSPTPPPSSSAAPQPTSAEAAPVETSPEPQVPAEHRAALAKAESYLEFTHFSKKKLFQQLTSEYGEGFPEDAAQYAVDNVEADWKAEALEAAINYRETLNMSNSSIREQLVSEYGEQFTEEEAAYAMENLPS